MDWIVILAILIAVLGFYMEYKRQQREKRIAREESRKNFRMAIKKSQEQYFLFIWPEGLGIDEVGTVIPLEKFAVANLMNLGVEIVDSDAQKTENQSDVK